MRAGAFPDGAPRRTQTPEKERAGLESIPGRPFPERPCSCSQNSSPNMEIKPTATNGRFSAPSGTLCAESFFFRLERRRAFTNSPLARVRRGISGERPLYLSLSRLAALLPDYRKAPGGRTISVRLVGRLRRPVQALQNTWTTPRSGSFRASSARPSRLRRQRAANTCRRPRTKPHPTESLTRNLPRSWRAVRGRLCRLTLGRSRRWLN